MIGLGQTPLGPPPPVPARSKMAGTTMQTQQHELLEPPLQGAHRMVQIKQLVEDSFDNALAEFSGLVAAAPGLPDQERCGLATNDARVERQHPAARLPTRPDD